jgi:two-component system NtrC family response regulator
VAAILIVDDDPIFCTPFTAYLKKLGHQCQTAQTFSQGAALSRDVDFDVVFLDVLLPDANGLECINYFINAPSSPELIIITGKSEISGAEMALENGAWDYLEKPPAYDDVKLTLKRALQFRDNKMVSPTREGFKSDFIIGRSPVLKKCLDLVAKSARTDGNLFISGETGTGKDLIANAVHMNSKRAGAPFIAVDCTNLPDTLVENLLFGHAKGAFTGAVDKNDGLIKQADKGTLFLDEVGDLSPAAQKSILRVLQNKTFRPLGMNKELSCDFRLISATNRDLQAMVEQGTFRKDLFYRLVTHHIHLPPLRERPDDIVLLADYYMEKICAQFGIRPKTMSDDFINTLMVYDWKGNIRELISVLHAAVAGGLNEPRLNPHHLPVALRIFSRKKTWEEQRPLEQGNENGLGTDETGFPSLKDFRLLNESQYLDALVGLSGGRIEKACTMAGVSRSGLYHLLEKHNKKLNP